MIQTAVNQLLEAELTAFLGYDPYAKSGWNSGNSRNGIYYRKVDTQFGQIEISIPTRETAIIFDILAIIDLNQGEIEAIDAIEAIDEIEAIEAKADLMMGTPLQ